MPANSADCRERAQRCAKLAAAAATPELAAVLSDIAQKWAVLAAELDRTDRALASWQMPQPKRSYTRAWPGYPRSSFPRKRESSNRCPLSLAAVVTGWPGQALEPGR